MRTSKRRRRRAAAPACALAALLGACAGTPAPVPGGAAGTALSAPNQADKAVAERSEIERLIERGAPSTLAEAVRLSRESKLLAKDDAAAYAYAAYETIRVVYPELSAPADQDAPPSQSHPVAKAIAAVRMGRPDAIESQGPFFDFLATLAAFRADGESAMRAVERAAERFRAFGASSAVAELAMGVVAERRSDYGAAERAFTAAYQASTECYPALFGLARVKLGLRDAGGSLDVLSILEKEFGQAIAWRTLKARALHLAGRYDEALPVATDALAQDPYAYELVLIRADILYRQGLYRQAQPLLDAYANVRPNDRAFLLLRARNYHYGLDRRDDAVKTLRKAASLYPGDAEIESELAAALAKGSREERTEALALAARLFATNPADANALAVLLDEDVRLRDWTAAAGRLDRLREAKPEWKNRRIAFMVYRGAGRLDEAAREAQAWFAEAPADEQAAAAWARVLVIDRKDRKAGAELVSRLLASGGTPRFRSELLYIQSFLQATDDAAIATLRASLIENIENLESLTALYDLYYKRGDYKQARFYLKLALSLAPADADLARRRNELMLKGVALP